LASYYLADIEVGKTIETMDPFEEFEMKPSGEKNVGLKDSKHRAGGGNAKY
jgi:hypothetical protein